MRTDVAPAFLQAEADALPQYAFKAVLRPNPEALRWQTLYTHTGVAGVSGAFRGVEQPHEGGACIGPDGSLVRFVRLSNGNIYVNRIGPGTDVPTPKQFQEWHFVTSGSLNYRPAISSDGQRVRLWYVNGGLCHRDSTDGLTWSAEFKINTGSYLNAALASPHPYLVFTCHQRFVNASNQNDATPYLEISAWDVSSGVWIWTPHAKSTRRVSWTNTPNASWLYWYAAYQFAAVLLDDQTLRSSVILLDNLSGRPSSTIYDRRHWSDYEAVEAIDFAEPERDELVGFRASRIGNKALLVGKRTVADSDFATTSSGVLYYSTNGRQWSDAYYICEGDAYNYGTPVLFRGQLYLVGSDRILIADATSMFGGVSGQELDITPSVRTISRDDPEDGTSPVNVTLELDNSYRQWSSHALLHEGAELDVYEGYAPDNLLLTFRGRLGGEPQPTISDNGASVLRLEAQDNVAQLGVGELDRSLVYPSPLRQQFFINSEADLKQFGTHGEWRYHETEGGYARAYKKGYNTLTRGSIFDGEATFSARVRLVNPHIEGPASGSGNALSSINLTWAASADFRNGYTFKCGLHTRTWSLYKAYNGKTVLLAEGFSTPEYWRPDVPVNRWFRMQIQQSQQVIICSMQFDDEQNSHELIRFVDNAPLTAEGLYAVSTTLMEEYVQPQPPTPQPGDDFVIQIELPPQPWATVDVDDVRIWTHTPETTGEEFLTGIAMQRGFDGVSAPAQVDETWLDGLTGWTQHRASGSATWATDAQGLSFTATSARAALLRSDYSAEDVTIDLDMTLPAGGGRFGIVARASADGRSFLALNIDAYPGVLSQPALQMVENGFISYYTYMPSLVPIYPGQRAMFRFVVSGPWCAIYVGGALCGTFYCPKLQRRGYIGLAQEGGSATTVGGAVRVHRLRVPVFDLTALPLLNPGDTLADAVADLISRQDGWMRADGRVLHIGTQRSSVVVDTLTNDVLLGGGFQVNYEARRSHCRVVSKTPDGEEISGHTYAIELAQAGRPSWMIETVDGLRTEGECRDRAWQLLLEQDRTRRTRSYPVQPRFRLEKYDLLRVTNTLDDTIAKLLLLVGSSRTITVDADSGAVTIEMTARLEEQNGETLTRATERPAA
jgi:hypothetical protein